MSTQEALEIVDIVVEALRERRILPEQNYGMMTEDQRHALAYLVEEHSNQ